MRTPDGLFFAPGLRFKDLDIQDSNALANSLTARAEKWFFDPAKLIANSSPFASGVIVVCFIDSAAKFSGMKMPEWLCEAVTNCAKRDPRGNNRTIAVSFKEDVRNGLVHHSRLNRGAEFSLDLEKPLEVVGSVLIVNPLLLLDAVEVRWQRTLDGIRSNSETHQRVAKEVQRVFKVDFQADEAWE
ncbi:hypothetical protein PJI16_16530 [Nitrospira sp. MA-1]|nr:hypothetical protein [Nitrospira sp. MA-1]